MLLTNALPKKVKTRNVLVLLECVTTKHRVFKLGEKTAEELEKILFSPYANVGVSKISGPVGTNTNICDILPPVLGILSHKTYPRHILANSVKKNYYKRSPYMGSRLGLLGEEFQQSCRIGSRYLLTNQYQIFEPLSCRLFHSGNPLYNAKPEVDTGDPKTKSSSKVEEAVKDLKEKQKNAVVEVKRPLLKRIQDELLHYYHGFRLLFIDMKIAAVLVWRILNGKTLSRREHRQLVRTTSDVFRLVPFSVFIIVPFMELLLPVFLKFFPGMLPSTFQTANEKESKMKAQLKVKLDMAKFLQQTLDQMAPQNKGRSSDTAKDFSLFIEKIRKSGGEATNDEILKYSKLFEDEITLDTLSKPQLIALCRVLEIPAIGNSTILLFQLKMKLRNLAADDVVIQKEGVPNLTLDELQGACKARGMRAFGVPEDRLRRQLEQWLQLSLLEKVPPSLLLLSRTMYLSEHLPETDKLKATLSSLPDSAALHTKGAIGEREGRVDNKTRIEILKEEEKKIKEERDEHQAKEEEVAAAAAPVEQIDPPMSTLLGPETTPMTVVSDVIIGVLDRKVPQPDRDAAPAGVSSEDVGLLETAIDDIGSQKQQMYMEKEELEDLKEEIQDYHEDVEDLKSLADRSVGAKVTVKESKGARLLFKKLNAMITEIDGEMKATQTFEAQTQLVATEDLMKAIQKFQKDPVRLKHISDLLIHLDEDKDGKIEVDDILKLVELIGRENITLTPKQMEEVIQLLNKEESLEVEAAKKIKIVQKSLSESKPPPPPQ